MTLEELEDKELELWVEIQVAEKTIQPLRSEWHKIYTQLKKAKLLEEIKNEINISPDAKHRNHIPAS